MQRVPFAFLEECGAAFAAAILRIDIALRPSIAAAGHVDLEGVGPAQLDQELLLAEKDFGIHAACPRDFNGQVIVYAGSGQCDRFCSKISVLTGLPMMP